MPYSRRRYENLYLLLSEPSMQTNHVVRKPGPSLRSKQLTFSVPLKRPSMRMMDSIPRFTANTRLLSLF